MGADESRAQPLKRNYEAPWGCFLVSSTSQPLELSVSFTIGYLDNGIASSSNEYIPSIDSSLSGEVNVIPSRTCALLYAVGSCQGCPVDQTAGCSHAGAFFYV